MQTMMVKSHVRVSCDRREKTGGGRFELWRTGALHARGSPYTCLEVREHFRLTRTSPDALVSMEYVEVIS
jgi:hypothetical protein